ncbi:MAG: hypothetical protein GY822_17160 [Deltaproteobacteria bacterium]|nr:hypothetical protein [Deltaproteobacteria bacterium]
MLSTLVFSVVLSFSPAARAESWVVLVQAKDKVAPKLVTAVQNAAKENIKKTNRRNKWINPPEASLDDVMMAIGCGDWGTQCAGAVANMMGATRALVVELAPFGDGVQARLAIVNNKGRALRSAQATMVQERLQDDLPFFIRSMMAKKGCDSGTDRERSSWSHRLHRREKARRDTAYPRK